METKLCNECKKIKLFSDFYTDPNNGKLRSYCKLCFNEKAKKYRDKKKDKIKEYSKLYREINKQAIKYKQKEYRQKNKDTIKERQKINSRRHYIKNCEIIKKKSLSFREINPGYHKEYRRKNKEYSNTYQKKRRRHDPLFKLIHNIRSRIYVFLNKKNILKNNSIHNIIGCSSEFLKEHLEKQFTDGMTWDLMGKDIHIDHIIPLSSAKTEEDIYKLCHYTNLQPLWAIDNLKKGAKLIYDCFKPSDDNIIQLPPANLNSTHENLSNAISSHSSSIFPVSGLTLTGHIAFTTT